MGAITKWTIFSVFTVTQSHPPLLFNGKGLRLKFGTLMRSITKGLIVRLTASTPIEGACIYIHHKRNF